MRNSNWINLFIFVLFLGQVANAETPICGGAVVPEDLPSSVVEASAVGEPVVLKQASQDKIHVIDSYGCNLEWG